MKNNCQIKEYLKDHVMKLVARTIIDDTLENRDDVNT